MTQELSDYELDVLKLAAGRESMQPPCWGAVMGEAIERLFGLGLITRDESDGGLNYQAAAAGLALLDARAGVGLAGGNSAA